MAVLLNLLPWRHLGRQRRWRFRASVMGLITVLLVALFWGGWTQLNQGASLLQTQSDELEARLHELQQTLQSQAGLLRRDPRQYQGRAENADRQYRVARWGDILVALTLQLPETSWLKTVSWQSGRLTLEGYTPEMGDLEIIEAGLTQVTSRFQVQAGPVSYEATKGLIYTFILEELGEPHVLP